jgi:serine/threonine protein kinase
LKVADFGFACSLKGDFGDNKLYDMLGTRGYAAPEIWDRRPYEGKCIDLFSAGCCLFIMKSMARPFR